MSNSILSQVIHSSWFRAEVASLIQNQIMERECIGYPERTATRGSLVRYEITGPLVFDPPQGEGLRFQVGFESRGVASGACKTSEGEDYTYARAGSIVGKVFLEMGPDTLIAEGFEQILGSAQLELTITDVETDDLLLTEGSREKFAGES